MCSGSTWYQKRSTPVLQKGAYWRRTCFVLFDDPTDEDSDTWNLSCARLSCNRVCVCVCVCVGCIIVVCCGSHRVCGMLHIGFQATVGSSAFFRLLLWVPTKWAAGEGGSGPPRRHTSLPLWSDGCASSNSWSVAGTPARRAVSTASILRPEGPLTPSSHQPPPQLQPLLLFVLRPAGPEGKTRMMTAEAAGSHCLAAARRSPNRFCAAAFVGGGRGGGFGVRGCGGAGYRMASMCVTCTN